MSLKSFDCDCVLTGCCIDEPDGVQSDGCDHFSCLERSVLYLQQFISVSPYLWNPQPFMTPSTEVSHER